MDEKALTAPLSSQFTQQPLFGLDGSDPNNRNLSKLISLPPSNQFYAREHVTGFTEGPVPNVPIVKSSADSNSNIIKKGRPCSEKKTIASCMLPLWPL